MTEFLNRYVCIVSQQHYDFLLFLYFGDLHGNSSVFAQRDLGLLKRLQGQTSEVSFYEAAEVARCDFQYLRAIRGLSAVKGRKNQLLALASGLDSLPPPVSTLSSLSRNKLFEKLGRYYEGCLLRARALSAYSKCSDAPGTTRRVRLLWSEGRREQAEVILLRMLRDPNSDLEAQFAEDFYARKFGGRRTSVYHDMLAAAEEIEVDEAYLGSPEDGVLTYLKRSGHRGWHVENAVWKMLFGLVFFDELFSKGRGGLAHSFTGLPQSLSTRTFHEINEVAIRHKLQQLSNGLISWRSLEQKALDNWDYVQQVFPWRQDVLEALEALFAGGPKAGLAAVLNDLAANFKSARTGFPDLVVADQYGAVTLVEVKATGDTLRSNQLQTYRQLETLGFSVKIQKVVWRVDPAQPYVVVDVETTGGRADTHRVTEIGAIRFENGLETGRFSTLVNPERAIPGYIERLTGISNQMVSKAPKFAEVALDLAEFLDGAVFTAHNVNFDYGFIKNEFERTGIHYRAPKLCTCQTMRRVYPGLKSYSLKNLARHFEIDLLNHHRALDDAVAAGQLFLRAYYRKLDLEFPSTEIANLANSPMTKAIKSPQHFVEGDYDDRRTIGRNNYGERL